MSTKRLEVILTFFLDWGFSFGAGLLFGFAGRREVARASSAWMRSRAFKIGLAYETTGLLAIAIVLYVLQPDWMWMYWVDPGPLPIAVIVVAFALYLSLFTVGFAITPSMSKRATLTLLLATGGALAVAEVLTRARLLHFGTFSEYHGGSSLVLLTHRDTTGLLLVIALPISLVALTLLVRRVWKQS